MIPEGNCQQIHVMQVTLSPAAVSANTSAEQTFTLPGVKLTTDTILSVVKPTAQAGLGIVGYRVTADNTLGITFMNNTGAGITPTASQVYLVGVVRIDGTPRTAIAL